MHGAPGSAPVRLVSVTQTCTPSSLFAGTSLPSFKPVCAPNHYRESSIHMGHE